MTTDGKKRTVREIDKKIPTAEEFEEHFQRTKEFKERRQREGVEFTLSLRAGFDMPLPPSRLDLLDRYAALRFMGYSPEELKSGIYSVAHGPDDGSDGE